ncbi:hypothetical protein [Xanthomonas sp. CFBP 8445]|uniref:hypothetical protein n=1 Tax=Xanthomonas sp. CFBP 8445 TaxID=2971236 RepID=UPI0021E0330D|nr:hypothetical protein [Xanthomonas sp. CFBP 8445]UYC12443.1 hypothetical protein NUG21_01460 [Xanthomonas sp. CFBP 8445]
MMFVMALLMGAATGPAHFSASRPQSFSNVCRVEEEGELLGTMLWILPAVDGTRLLVQRYEAGPLAPRLLSARVEGDRIVAHSDHNEPLYAVRRDGKGARITYLDGEEGRDGGHEERLSPVLILGEFPNCK